MSEIKTNAKHLLSSATSIRKKYEEIYKITGENFNIFDICQLERNEDKLHSNLITDLLNPNGRHSMGSVFLNLFLETIDKTSFFKDKKDKDEQLDNLIVTTQKYTDQGIIDIAIENKEKIIILENKIDAYDQPDQLNRYYNWAKTKYQNKNITIIYLTKFGKSPDETSISKKYIEKMNDNYLEISYKDHIKEWIETCIKEVSLKPGIREALNHYLRTVKKITNQSLSIKEEKEMEELIIKNKDNYSSAKAIHAALPIAEKNLKIEFYKKLFQSIEENIVKSNENLSISIQSYKSLNEILEKKYEEKNFIVKITNNNWNSKDINVYIYLQFQEKFFEYLLIGLNLGITKNNIKNHVFHKDYDNIYLEYLKKLKTISIFKNEEQNEYGWLNNYKFDFEIDEYIKDKILGNDTYFKITEKEVLDNINHLLETYKDSFKDIL